MPERRKLLRQDLNLVDDARLDRLDRLKEQLGLASRNEVLRVLIDEAAERQLQHQVLRLLLEEAARRQGLPLQEVLHLLIDEARSRQLPRG